MNAWSMMSQLNWAIRCLKDQSCPYVLKLLKDEEERQGELNLWAVQFWNPKEDNAIQTL